MKLNLSYLILVGSMALVACENKHNSTSEQVLGGPCSVEGQRSDCAKDGFPAACDACQGYWLYCLNGKWTSAHCDRMPDAGVDRHNAADVTPDVSSTVDNRGAMDTDPVTSSDSSNDTTGETSLPNFDAAVDEPTASDVPSDVPAIEDGPSDAADIDGSDA